jgi:hypothetical protein
MGPGLCRDRDETRSRALHNHQKRIVIPAHGEPANHAKTRGPLIFWGGIPAIR